MADDPKKDSFIDRLGPALTSGLIIAGLSAVSLGAVALRDLVVTTGVDIAYLKQGRDDHEARIRAQEQRPPRLSTGLDEIREQCASIGELVSVCRERVSVIERDIKHVESEQDKLCSRVQSCARGNSR